MATYEYESIDVHKEENDPDKAGFNDLWIGVANSLEHTILVETHIESTVPEETEGWEFELGGGNLLGLGGLPVGKVYEHDQN
jgi:hypothetical protein